MLKHLILFSCCSLLAAAAQLKIERATLAQMEDGVPLPPDSHFLNGETVFFSCRVSGYAREGDEPPKMHLTYQIEVKDSKGTPVIPAESGKVQANLEPEDKEWMPKISSQIALPPLADPG